MQIRNLDQAWCCSHAQITSIWGHNQRSSLGLATSAPAEIRTRASADQHSELTKCACPRMTHCAANLACAKGFTSHVQPSQPLCPLSIALGTPDLTSHTTTLQSQEPEASVLPVAQKARHATMPVCPAIVWTCVLDFVSQSSMHLSCDPVASKAPSGANVKHACQWGQRHRIPYRGRS